MQETEFFLQNSVSQSPFALSFDMSPNLYQTMSAPARFRGDNSLKSMRNMLRDLRPAFYPFVLVFLVIVFANCSGGKEQAPLPWEVRFVSLGVEIHFGSPDRRKIQQIRALSATDAEEFVVAQLRLDSYPRTMEPLHFRWENGKKYRFEVQSQSGKTSTKTLQAPQSGRHGTIEIAIPYGTVANESFGTPDSATTSPDESLVLQGSDITMTLLLRNGLSAPVEFEVDVEIPRPLQALEVPEILGAKEGVGMSNSAPDGDGDKTSRFFASGRFTVESEVWYRQVELYVPAESLPDSTRISGRALFKTSDGESWERQTSVSLRTATIDEIGALISIEDVLMPTDEAGVFDSRQQPDVISYPQPVFGRFGKWLGVQTEQSDYFQPITYQSVRLRNDGENTIHLLVSAVNLNTASGNPVPFLAPPDEFNAGTNRSFAFVSLAPQSAAEVPLPIFFNPSIAQEGASRGFKGKGNYQREIEVKVWGSDTTVLRATRPLHITTPNRGALVVTVSAFASTIAGLILFFGYHQSIFSRFSTKQLILVSLFGATIFVCVSVPSTLLANLIAALLGPASFLVTGLINEMLYYALLTALLMLIPKPGVIALVSIVRALLGGVVLGLFNPTTLVYTGVSILLLETGFKIARNGRHLLLLALVFGVCDALAVGVDFQLSMTLYRLFYADWYIIARCVVDGFIYTFVGVLLGRRLGWGLWRVAE